MPVATEGDGEGEFISDAQGVMKIWLETVHAKVQARNERSSEVLGTTGSADADLATLETSFYHLERCMRRHISLQQRRRNQLVPISQLPAELLVRIIFLSLQCSSSSRGYEGKLQNISQVCTRWSELVKGTALFWGVVSSSDTPATVLRALSNSKDTPLDIWYNGLSGSTFEMTPFLQAAVGHSHRWRSLELQSAERDVEDRLMELPTPILHDLTIRRGYIADESGFPDLSIGAYGFSMGGIGSSFNISMNRINGRWEGRTPNPYACGRTPNPYAFDTTPPWMSAWSPGLHSSNTGWGLNEPNTHGGGWGVVGDGVEVQNAELRGRLCIPNDKLYALIHLSLRGDSILWETTALSRLESLELKSLGPTGPTMTQLIAIFRASPGLVVLTLDLLHLEDPDHFTHDIVPVDLSRLTDLMLSRLSVRSLRDLLTHIRIPTCHRLKANCTHEPQVRVFDSQTAHLGSPIREILSATGLANIHLTPDTVEISTMLDDPANVGTATPNCALYLHLPSGPSLGPIGWLSRVFSAMIPPPTINLIIQAPTRSSQIIPLPSSLLPYVDQLCIIGSETEAAMWIRLLSEPVTLANGEAQWTLPHLTRLVFDSCNPDAEDLMKMIRRRYGGKGGTAVTSRQDDVEQQLQPSREPVSLKYLRINSTDRTLPSSQQMETLRSIVGSEACLIRGWENVDEMT